jgi:ATP-dependent DNA ligase
VAIYEPIYDKFMDLLKKEGGYLCTTEEREKFIHEIASQGFAKDFETKLKRKDGTPIDVLITASVRKDEAGHFIGYEGIMAKKKDSPYLFGKRSSSWLKMKPKQCHLLHCRIYQGEWTPRSIRGFVHRGKD